MSGPKRSLADRAVGRAGSDAGFSLVELLVYVVLSALAMAVLGGIMLNGFRVQTTVTSIGSASATASIISRSVEQGIGNASAFKIEPATALGQLLRARTATGAAGGTATWTCRAWFYSAADSRFYTKSGASMIAAPTAASDLSSWTLLGTGVSSTSAFSLGSSASVLKLSFTVTATGTQPVLVSTSEQTTTTDSTGTACF